MTVRTVAMLTAGGLAPCLSSAVGGLIERYGEVAPDVRIIAYLGGYAGLLRGEWVEVTPEVADGPHSVILQQVSNGIAVRMAVMSILAGNR